MPVAGGDEAPISTGAVESSGGGAAISTNSIRSSKPVYMGL